MHDACGCGILRCLAEKKSEPCGSFFVPKKKSYSRGGTPNDPLFATTLTPSNILCRAAPEAGQPVGTSSEVKRGEEFCVDCQPLGRGRAKS